MLNSLYIFNLFMVFSGEPGAVFKIGKQKTVTQSQESVEENNNALPKGEDGSKQSGHRV